MERPILQSNRKINSGMACVALGLGIILLSIFLVCFGADEDGLSFERSEVFLEKLDADVEIAISFPFENVSSNLIRITNVKADCRCTEISPKKMDVKAGEKGCIDVKFRTSKQSGVEEHAIVVFTDMANRQPIWLKISAEVNPRVEFIPSVIAFGALSRGSAAEPRQISVLSRFRENAKVVGVSSSIPYFKARLLDTKPTHSREIGRIEVVPCGDAAPGKIEGELTIEAQTEEGVVTNLVEVSAQVLECNSGDSNSEF